MPPSHRLRLSGRFATVADVQAQIAAESTYTSATPEDAVVGNGLPEGVDSRFRYVLLVSRRAEQLIMGQPRSARAKRLDEVVGSKLDIFDRVIRRRSESPIVESDSPRDPNK